MRIVAGLAGGIPLQIPGHDLRPTMDKVRAAIFSSLGERVAGARVLDLFSGTGAMGLEAMSRGAVSATLVESNARALDSLQTNLAKTRLSATIVRDDAFRFLKRNTSQFELIFADPPYTKNHPKNPDAPDFASQLLHSEDLLRALAPDALFILERAPADPPPSTSLFQLLRQKRYGASEILYLTT